MSGIAGIIDFSGAPLAPGLIEGMTSALAHRGADGATHWKRESVALGHCLFRTTEESLQEHQPLTSEDGKLVLIMDGRLDNWEDIRRQLAGRRIQLRDAGDAELVLRAYQVWGEECLRRFEGDYAIAIWNQEHRKLLCARDIYGVRPLYYYWDGKRFVFSSEPNAILDLPWIQARLNKQVVAEWLAMKWYSRQDTFWKDVFRLPAAHHLEVDAGSLRKTRYWEPDLHRQIRYRSDTQYIEHYRHLLEDVVGRMTRSHKPVAFEVSGGLDSSSLFGTAAYLANRGRLKAPGLLGYGLAFPLGDPGREVEYMRAVGEHVGIPIQEFEPTYRALEWYQAEARRRREFPGMPNGTMSIDLREAARDAGARVIVSGQGGDEWTGLPRRGIYYADLITDGNLNEFRRAVRDDIATLGAPRTAWWVMRYGLLPLLPQQAKLLARKLVRRRGMPMPNWLQPELRALVRTSGSDEVEMNQNFTIYSQRLQYKILNDAYLATAYEMEDRLSSQIGIERRCPFFNKEVVQFAFSTTERTRLRGTTVKWLLREAMKDLLPTEVYTRSDKADFMSAFAEQMRESGDRFELEILPRRATWVEPEKIELLLGDMDDAHVLSWAGWVLWAIVGCDAVALTAE